LKSRKTTYNREVDAILGARLFKNLAVTRGSFVNVAGPLAKKFDEGACKMFATSNY
jgi:hypothetical protein